jgi:hypothetical protein
MVHKEMRPEVEELSKTDTCPINALSTGEVDFTVLFQAVPGAQSDADT